MVRMHAVQMLETAVLALSDDSIKGANSARLPAPLVILDSWCLYACDL